MQNLNDLPMAEKLTASRPPQKIWIHGRQVVQPDLRQHVITEPLNNVSDLPLVERLTAARAMASKASLSSGNEPIVKPAAAIVPAWLVKMEPSESTKRVMARIDFMNEGVEDE